MEIRAAILTISDRSSRGERVDGSGPALRDMVQGQGWVIIYYEIVPDNYNQIKSKLSEWADSGDLDIILTTGGTGFSPSDITPEATRGVIDRDAPGISEAIRSESLKITPHAMLSRAISGIRKHTIIINLPGSPKAAVENLNIILSVLPHAVSLLREDPESEKGHAHPS